MSGFVVWARVRRQIEAMLVKGNMGRRSKRMLLRRKYRRDSREIGREQTEQNGHETAILTDDSRFTEAVNYS